jgi:hypothetical protein
MKGRLLGLRCVAASSGFQLRWFPEKDMPKIVHERHEKHEIFVDSVLITKNVISQKSA